MNQLSFYAEQNGSTARSWATDVAAYRDLAQTYARKTQLASVTLMRPHHGLAFYPYQYQNPYESSVNDPRLMSPTRFRVVANPFPYGKLYASSDSQRNNRAAMTTQSSQFALQTLYRWALGLS